MKGSFVTSDGLSLGYEDTGTGLPLLCLPGLTRNARDFDDLAEVLPEGFRMLRLTFRGREGSDWAEDFNTYAIPVEARDVIEFLDHMGLERVAILGTSRGGLVAMVLAAMARDRLLGVVLNDIGPELVDAGLDRIKGYLGKRPRVGTYEEMAVSLERDMGTEFPGLSAERWRVLAERWFRQDVDGMALRYDPRIADATAAQAEAGPAPDLWPLFDALEGLPVGVIRGENSDLLSAETMAKMAARRPDLIARDVPDRGHVPFLDEAESLRVLREFREAVAR